jgi:tRNA-specific 2-thiouridylase
VVGPRQAETRDISLRDVNWLIEAPHAPVRANVKLRAREVPQPAEINVTEDGVRLVMDNAARPAPGQAAVFYDGSRILGGGFII